MFIKGYLNSYSTNNNIQLFITVTDISDNKEDILNGRKSPILDMTQMELWYGMEKDAKAKNLPKKN